MFGKQTDYIGTLKSSNWIEKPALPLSPAIISLGRYLYSNLFLVVYRFVNICLKFLEIKAVFIEGALLTRGHTKSMGDITWNHYIISLKEILMYLLCDTNLSTYEIHTYNLLEEQIFIVYVFGTNSSSRGTRTERMRATSKKP